MAISPTRTPIITAVLIDVVCVVTFAVIGRASHDEALSVEGVAHTAWPFVTALVIGWVTARATLRVWPVLLRHAWLVWLVTLVGGMALRRVAGDGTATAFVIVAAVFLAVTLFGWRAIAGVAERVRTG